MEEVTLESLPKSAKDFFNRGFTAIERGNIDYAIEMLSACVAEAPRFVRAWKFLRAAEVKRFRKKKAASSLSAGIETVMKMPTYLSASGLLKSGKSQAALMKAAKLLREDPENTKYCVLFAQAAVACEIPEVAILTLETCREANPDDITVLSWLGAFYQKSGRMRSARECFEHLCELNPNDPAALKQLKDAMALDSMSNDGWQRTVEQGGSFRDMLKDEEEAAMLEQQAKSTKSDAGSDTLIADMMAKIAAEPKNINYRRALAKLYLQKQEFEAGIAALQEAVEMNPGDPELERAVTSAQLQYFDSQIEVKRNAGDEDGAVALEHERLQFRFDDLQAKVERYPNDLQLRFEWGVMLFENDYINEAIQQLQIAQRSAKNRVMSLYYLGVCFRSKNQFEIACRQLETAIKELPIMDANKKKVLYELGELALLMNDKAKASDAFMQIYQSDISYRDVSARVESLYADNADKA